MLEVAEKGKEYLKETPRYEEWLGEGGKSIISEKLFVLGHEGNMIEIDFVPTYKIGANSAYYAEEEGLGEPYEKSISKAGIDIETNSFLIIKRKFENWTGQDPVDEITVILIR